MSPMSEISSTISSTSTTAQRRKIKKPLIEKRRRLRINQCLAGLKSLVLEATNKDENCFPKMEKADILEMTVAYMRTVNRRSPTSASCPPDGNDHARTYLSGYRECAMEVFRFMEGDESLPAGVPEVRAQLTRHLSGCFQRIQQDLQLKADHPGQFATSIASGLDGVNGEKRCEADRLPSPSFSTSSSRHSSSSSPVPISSPVPPSSVAEVSRNHGSISAGTAIPFSTPYARRVADPSRDSKPQLLPTAVFSSTLQPSLRPTLLERASLLARHCHQSSLPSQPNPSSLSQCLISQCLSPKKGDEFPVVTTIRTSPVLTTTTRRNQSATASRTVAFSEPLPVSEDHSTMIWRPW